MASLGGMEMWCGRLSFSPFIERRNCSRVSTRRGRRRGRGGPRGSQRRAYLHSGRRALLSRRRDSEAGADEGLGVVKLRLVCDGDVRATRMKTGRLAFVLGPRGERGEMSCGLSRAVRRRCVYAQISVQVGRAAAGVECRVGRRDGAHGRGPGAAGSDGARQLDEGDHVYRVSALRCLLLGG